MYLNDGRGAFRKARSNLPTESISGSRVVAADYDGDGDVDLFVGGRVVLWRYGLDPQSTLLRNDGRGRFTDVTDSWRPSWPGSGWSPTLSGRTSTATGGSISSLSASGCRSRFSGTRAWPARKLGVPGLEKSHGWWNRIVADDFTGDGRIDFIVGNLGLNTRLRAGENEPVTMHVKDFDGNGFVEQIVSCYNQGVSYPLPLRDDLIKALPFLKTRYLNYKDYARQTVDRHLPAGGAGRRSGENGVHIRYITRPEQRQRILHARAPPRRSAARSGLRNPRVRLSTGTGPPT